MEGSDAGWGRATEPAPRWRALLDRALLGGRTAGATRGACRSAYGTGASAPATATRRARPPRSRYPPDLPYAPAPEFGPAARQLSDLRPGYGQPWQDEPGWRRRAGVRRPPRRTVTRRSPPTTATASGTRHRVAATTAPDAEVERAIGVLRRDLGGPRVLAFANPKGGVHKTTATVLAAATVGSVRGRGRAGLGRQRAARHARPAGRQRPARPHDPAPGRRPGRGRGAARATTLTDAARRLPAARLRRRRTTCWPARRTRASPSGSTRTRCAGCSSCCAAPTT